MRALLSLPLVLVLASCGSHGHEIPADPTVPLEIINDGGGNLLDYVALRKQLKASGQPVYLRGYIASAATILTTLPNACIGLKSVLGFHGSSTIGVPIVSDIVEDRGNDVIGSYYRAGIKDKWESEWQHSKDIHKITAATAIALDPQLRYCPK